jgi:TolB-like protein/Flp pilus assembly protein TadD
VLSFMNTNPDSTDDYLGYGVATELARAVGELPGLRVAAGPLRASGNGRDEDPLILGSRLGVGTVLYGTIRRSGDHLRVTAHLVDVAQGFDLWSETYDQTPTDLLQIQRDITEAIAGTLRISAAGDSAAGFRWPTSSPEAYDAYLVGIYRLNRSGPQDPERAVASLNDAVRLDSSFALALSALAQAHLAPFQQALPPRLTMLTAETTAVRALELDSTLAAPHRTLGLIRFGYHRDWVGAEAEFRRAIVLDPSASEGYQAYARFLLALGRSDEALAASERAVALNPASSKSAGQLGWYYLYARQYDQARALLSHAIELDSTEWRAHLDLVLLEQATGNYDQARAQFERGRYLAPLRIETVTANAQLRALSGEPEVARATLKQLEDTSLWGYVSPYYIACIEAALGQRNEAFVFLTRAVKERSDLVPYLGIDPRVESLRTDPRFSQLLRQIGLGEHNR